MQGTIKVIQANGLEQEVQISEKLNIDLADSSRVDVPFDRNDLTDISFTGETLELTLIDGTNLVFEKFVGEDGVLVPLFDPSGTLIFANITALLSSLQTTAAGNPEAEIGNGSGFFPEEQQGDDNQESGLSYRNLRNNGTDSGDGEDGDGTGTGFVPAPNLAPIAVDDVFSYTEAEQEADQLVGNLLTNDSDLDSNVELTVSSVNGELLTGDFVTVTLDSGVEVTVFSNGLFIVQQYQVHGDLAEGEVVTENFVYEVSDGQDSTEASVSITVTGTNDIPEIRFDEGENQGRAVEDFLFKERPFEGDPIQDGPFEGPNEGPFDGPFPFAIPTIQLPPISGVKTSGQLSVFDPDNGATATWTVIDSDGTYGSLTVDQNGIWSYGLYYGDTEGGNRVQALNQNEEVTDTFTIVVTDDQGATDQVTITLTVVGTNDQPEILTSQIDYPGTETDTGNNTFTGLKLSDAADVDAADTDLTYHLQSRSISSNNPVVTSYSVTVHSGGTFDLSGDFNGLAAGETATISFSYYVNDNNGVLGLYPDESSISETATASVTVTGTNDTPVISVDEGDSTGGTLTETDSALSLSGSLSVTDIDQSDLVSGSVTGVTVSGLNNNITNQTLLNMMSVNSSVIDGSNTEGSLNWSFASTPETFDYLGLGESLTLTYTLQVSDDAASAATDQQTVTITINGTNDTPTVAAALSKTINEDAAGIKKLKLLKGADDADINDTLHVESLQLQSGDATGISLSGNGKKLLIDPAHYQYLAKGEKAVVTYSYLVVDNHGASTPQSATITINGRNDAPTVDGIVKLALNEDRGSVKQVSLLNNVSDVDTTDVLRVKFGTLELLSGNDEGVTFDRANNLLKIDPSPYQYLAAGEKEVIRYSYTVTDGNGGKVTQYAKVVVHGRNDAPQISVQRGDSKRAVLNEDDAPQTTSGTLTVRDIDISDSVSASVSSLSVSGPTGSLNPFALLSMMTVDTTPVIDGSSTSGSINWDFDSASEAFNYLAQGETLTLKYKIKATDSNGASDGQNVKITIKGTNDAPEISAAPSETFSTLKETDSGLSTSGDFTVSDLDLSDSVDASFSLTSVTGFDNGIGNTALEAMMSLSVSEVIAAGSDAGSLTWSFDSDQEAFDYLAVGESLQLVYTVTVDDGLAQDQQTVTITIQGTNDGPQVAGQIRKWVSEDRPTIREIDLLEGATDADLSDTLSVDLASIQRLNGNPAGVRFVGNTVQIDPEAYQYLDAGDRHVLKYQYDIVDGNGGIVTQTASIVLIGKNDIPTVRKAINKTFDEDQAGNKQVNLLKFASDADEDAVLNVTDLNLRNSEADDSGVRLSRNGNKLIITPSAYEYLAEGETETLIYEYVVDDGEGGRILTTATINIEGRNDQPVVNDIVLTGADSVSEDDLKDANSFYDAKFVSFLAGTDTDDSDSLSFSIKEGSLRTIWNGDAEGLEHSETRLVLIDEETGKFRIVNQDFDKLGVGDSAVVVFKYRADDGNGFGNNDPDGNENSLSDWGTVRIRITGTNDAPEFAGPVFSFNVDEGDVTVIPLAEEGSINRKYLGNIEASDVDYADSESLSFEIVSASYAGDSGTVTVDPQLFGIEWTAGSNTARLFATEGLDRESQDSDLAAEQYNIVIRVRDPQGGTSEQTYTVNINDINDNAPVANDDQAHFDENGNPVIEQQATVQAQDPAPQTGIIKVDVISNDTDADVTENALVLTEATLNSATISNGISLADRGLDISSISAQLGIDSSTGEVSLNTGTLFDVLNPGETVTVVIDYTVADQNNDPATAVHEVKTDSGQLTLTLSGVADAPVISETIQFQGRDDSYQGKTTLYVNTTALWDSGDISDADQADSRNTLRIAEGDNAPVVTNIEFSQNLSLTPEEINSLKEAIKVQTTQTNRGGDRISLDYDNAFFFMPAGVTATISLTYKLEDSVGLLSNQATATLVVTGTNQSSILKSDFTKVFENGASKEFDVLKNDFDPEGDQFGLKEINSVVLRDKKNGGALVTLEGSEAGVVDASTITINNNKLVIDQLDQFDYLQKGESDFLHITYETTDGQTATAVVEIKGRNDKPELTLLSSQVTNSPNEIIISDVDIADTVNLELVSVRITGDAAPDSVPEEDLINMLSLSMNREDVSITGEGLEVIGSGETAGSVFWDFVFDDANYLNLLDEGQTATVTYEIQATDSKGGSSTIQQISINLEGTDEGTSTAGEGAVTLLTNGKDSILLSDALNIAPVDALSNTDTIIVDQVELDFTNLDGFSNFERIDLGTGDAGRTLLNINAEDVLNLSSSNNKITILGDEDDQVQLDISPTAWEESSSNANYTTYSYANSQSKLLIDNDIDVFDTSTDAG